MTFVEVRVHLDVTLPDDAVRRLEAAAEFTVGFPGDFIADASRWVFGEVSGGSTADDHGTKKPGGAVDSGTRNGVPCAAWNKLSPRSASVPAACFPKYKRCRYSLADLRNRRVHTNSRRVE